MPTPPPWWKDTQLAPVAVLTQRVEDRPVGDRVRAVAHRLGLPLGRGDRARVEVVAADHDRRPDLARGDHLVEAQPGAVALAVARASRCAPAGPGSGRARCGELDPARGCAPGRRTARGSPGRWRGCRRDRPTARPSGTAPCPRRTAAGCRRARSRGRRRRRRRRARPRARAARCRSRTPPRRAGRASRIASTCASTDSPDALQVVVGIRAPQHVGLLDGEPRRDVAVERVVRARLVRHDVDRRVAAHQLREDLRGVAEQADRQRAPLAPGRRRAASSASSSVSRRARPGSRVCDAGARCAAGRPRRTARSRSFMVTASGWAPPIPPSPAVTTSRPAQRAAEALARDRRERLVGALEDPLRADVDPRARRSSGRTSSARPRRARGSAPRSPIAARGWSWRSARAARAVRLEHRHGLAGLHEQRLVVAQRA